MVRIGVKISGLVDMKTLMSTKKTIRDKIDPCGTPLKEQLGTKTTGAGAV